MRNRIALGFISVLVLILLSGFNSHAQTTEFSYQGYLNDNSQPANGNYDFEFALFDALTGGTQLASTITRSSVPVSGGIFNVVLDFGAEFPGAGRWLEIGVRQSAPLASKDVVLGTFTTLSPRQPITSTPYAIRSLTVTGPLAGSDPTARLLVTNSQPGIPNPDLSNLPPAAVRAETTSSTPVTAAIVGVANKGLGIIGITKDDNSVGDSAVALTGFATSSSGQTRAVAAEVFSPDGIAVEARIPQGGTGFVFNGGDGTTDLFTVKSNGDVYALGDVSVIGDLGVSGTKSNIVKTADGQTVRLYAVEAPENWFEDFGTSMLRRGRAIVKIDKMFAEVTNTGIPYKVFLTPNGECRGLFVSRKTAESFEVRELGGGKSDVSFDYRIVARRRGYESERFAPGPEANPKN